MKLIRFGSLGQEKPGILIGEKDLMYLQLLPITYLKLTL